MFHLQDSDLKQFFEDQKKELNEELRELVNVYEHSVHKARHVELQILDWQNAHNDEVIAAGRGLQQWSESFVADDLKSKFEQTNQYLTDLSNHQQALDEQIETLMSLKQPVQHETTYLLKNSQDPNQAYNVTVLSGKQVQPKLTYEQFCQRLYSQEQDSESVEHLVKQETAQMVNGLLELQRSVLGAAQSVDEAETVAKCKEKSTHIQQLIQRINKLDRLAFMTVIEHGKLKTQLLSMKKVRTSETASMSHQIEQVHDRRKQIQVCNLTLYKYPS